MSVKAERPKAAPGRQTQASKQKRKKKKGKADLSDKSSQAEPAKQEEDLDQLLTELNIKLVCPLPGADHASFRAAEPSSTCREYPVHCVCHALHNNPLLCNRACLKAMVSCDVCVLVYLRLQQPRWSAEALHGHDTCHHQCDAWCNGQEERQPNQAQQPASAEQPLLLVNMSALKGDEEMRRMFGRDIVQLRNQEDQAADLGEAAHAISII